MSFLEQDPHPFTRSSIESLSPNQSGVYGLFKPGAWIYVGKGDIRERLLSHLNGDNPCIIGAQPTSWVAELITGDPSNREKELIRDLRPTCNDRIG